ncbi:MAG: UDP-N-acetylmuramate dehydrogenase [Candidatus Pelethousia sp.]|nr:UDP-N-acetylmuramate dehydrogenase [Candidatus Pelethousia sp.]
MEQRINRLFAILAPYGAVRDVPLSAHTSFRIGGPAQLFFEPGDREALSLALQSAQEEGVTVTLMGNGSNLLVSDAGVEGLVVKLGSAFSGIELGEDGQVFALAGTLLSSLANFAADHGLMGLEWAAGIPGSVGGALAMNAGAYGGEIRQVLSEVEYFDAQTGGFLRRVPAEGEMGYRKSAFAWPARVATAAVFRLAPDDGGMRERMREYSEKRRTRQPLTYPSAGSVFKRPQGHFAGALIEAAGLKGAAVGGAEVSELHAGFIINTGNASSADVRALIELVRRKVLEHSGVLLEPEIKFIGREQP